MADQQLIEQAKALTGVALAMHLERVLKAKEVYMVGELLDLPNVKALGAEHAKTLAVLDLLARQNWSDYVARKAELGQLHPAVEMKLKALTLVSLATEQKSLRYADIGGAVGAGSTAAVEEVIITAMYAGLLHGKMDQRTGMLEVSSTVGRDIRPEQLAGMLAKLQAWQRLVGTAREGVAGQLAALEAQKREQEAAAVRLDKRVAEAQKELSRRHGAGPGGLGGGLDRDARDALLLAAEEGQPEALLMLQQLQQLQQVQAQAAMAGAGAGVDTGSSGSSGGGAGGGAPGSNGDEGQPEAKRRMLEEQPHSQ